MTIKSISDNPKAIDAYNEGTPLLRQNNYEDALPHFQKAVKIDPNFPYAWDNIGICQRRLGNLDKALEAYKKSLAIDPSGKTPLRNIAVVYTYKKEYKKAIKWYKKSAKLDQSDPEIFYGIGRIQAIYLNHYEKGLNHLCKAYNIYVGQHSPYRTDAEKIINLVYTKMKENGQENQFKAILKKHNIRY